MPAKEAYNFKKFTDDIDTSGVVGELNTAGLAGENYVAVVNLLPDESEYALPQEKEIVESQGLRYYYRPIDFSAPTNDDYEWFEATVKALPAGKALIHCAANYRVSTFSTIYAFRNLGWSSAESRQFVSNIWDISEYPVWDGFFKFWLVE